MRHAILIATTLLLAACSGGRGEPGGVGFRSSLYA